MKNFKLFPRAILTLFISTGLSFSPALSYTSVYDAVTSSDTDKEYSMTADEVLSSDIGSMGGTTLSLTGDNYTVSAGTTYSGLSVAAGQTLDINNVNFSNFNNASGHGGVIANLGNITNVVGIFSNNAVSTASYYGGAIYNANRIEYINGTFTGNSAKFGGGVFNNDGNTQGIGAIGSTTQKAVFQNNTVTNNGGGVYAGGTVSNVYAEFTSNSATSGGGMFIPSSGRVTNLDADFTSNTASSQGGGLYNTGVVANQVTGTFTSNTAANGGGFYNHAGTLQNGINATFTSNTVTGSGGAIYNNTNGTLQSVSGTFTSNRATGSGGAIYNTGTISTLSATFGEDGDATKANYVVNNDGGAVYNNKTITNLSSDFYGNYTNGGGGGGALYNSASGSVGTLSGSFVGNYTNGTNSTYSHGGAIWNAGRIENISGATFTSNTSNRKAGAIYNTGTIGLASDGTTVTGGIVGNFSSDSANNGGAIYNSGKISDIDSSSTFESNSANTYGGAIYSEGSIGYATDGTTVTGSLGGVFGNSADNTKGNSANRGGAIYIASGSVSSIDGSFYNNSATTYGGAIAFWEANSVGSVTGTFIGNTAQNGGAIINLRTINDLSGTYTGNTATAGGGAVFLDSSLAVINTMSGTYDSNTAGTDGGAIFLRNGNIYDLSGTFTNNTATTNGGAIATNSGTTLNITTTSGNTLFSGNTAAGDSNALYNMGTVNMNAGEGSTITFNDSIKGSSGTININDSTVKSGMVDGTIIFNNTVTGNTLNLKSGIMQLGTTGDVSGATALNVSGGSIDLQEGTVSATPVNLGALTLTSDMGLAIDANLSTGSSDEIAVSSLSNPSGNSIIISAINLVADAATYTAPISVTVTEDASLIGIIDLASDFSITNALRSYIVTYSTSTGQLTFGSGIGYAVSASIPSKVYNMIQDESVSSALGSMGGTSLIINGGQDTLGNLYTVTGNGNEGTTVNSGKSLEINDSNWTGFVSSGNGSVIKNYGASLTVKNSKFENNTAGNNGGVIANEQGGQLSVSGSNFSNNSTTGYYGGAISNSGWGAASTISKIENSTFASNSAMYGGAIYNENHGTNTGTITSLTNSTFIGNSATNNGGAISNTGVITTVSNTNFGNSADNTSHNSSANGGAIYNSGTIGTLGANFYYNTATSNGGAIYNTNSITSLNGDFVGNTATSGGAIYNTGASMGAINGNFSENHVSGGGSNGGAIYNTGTIASITAGTDATDNTDGFYNNYVSNGSDGGAIYNSGTITGNLRADFSGNYATAGGAINNTGTIGGIVSGLYSGNHTTEDGTWSYAGAIYNRGSSSSINTLAANFNQNTAYLSGGAVLNDGTITSLFGIYSGNVSTTGNGGAIYNSATGKIGETAGVYGVFYNNTASSSNGKGGAIANLGTIGAITGAFGVNPADMTTPAGNQAVSGGAIYNEGTITSLGTTTDDVLFSSNSATNGGAVYNAQSHSIGSIDSALFVSNSATTSAGAVYNAGSITSISADFGDSTDDTLGNTSANAGAVYNTSTGSIGTIEGGFYYNKSTGNAGALRNESTISSISGNFVGNEAQSGSGGAIYNSGTITEITDTNFTNNTATVNGGAIYNTGTITVKAVSSDVTFSGNTVGSTYNDIYNTNILNLNAAASKSIVFGGTVDGSSGTININTTATSDTDAGTIEFNNAVSNNTINFNHGTIKLGSSGNFDNTVNFNVKGCVLDLVGNGTQSKNLGNLTLENDLTLNIDASLSGTTPSADYITADSIDDDGNHIVISTINVTSDSDDYMPVVVDVASAVLSDYVQLDTTPKTVSGVALGRSYLVTYGINSSDIGQLTFGYTSLKEAVNSTIAQKAYYMAVDENVTTDLGVLGGTSLAIHGNSNYNINGNSNGGIDIGSATASLSIGSVGSLDSSGNVVKSWNGMSTSGSGAVIFNRGGTLTITDSVFYNNSATANGGVIAQQRGGITDSISGSAFIRNTSGSNGGAIFNSGFNSVSVGRDGVLISSISNTTFKENSANAGGAIYNASVNASNTAAITSISGGNFTQNSATTNGGAIYNKGIIGTISSTFTSNQAANMGGAIYNNGTIGDTTDLSVVAVGGTFTGNRATASESDGGAIYNAADSTITTTAGVFNSNSVSRNGGAISNHGTMNVIEGIFGQSSTTGNSSTYGGAIYNAGTLGRIGDASVMTTGFVSNSAYEGGAIFNENNTITAINANFAGNTATDKGGAIYTKGNINSLSGLFNGNTAANDGGAIYNQGGTVVINNTNFTNNTATSGNGGAIYNTGTLTVNATGSNVSFSGNTANGASNDIHNTATLNLNAGTYVDSESVTQPRTITFAGTITDASTTTGSTAVTGGGVVNFNNTVTQNNLSLASGSNVNVGVADLKITNSVSNSGTVNLTGNGELTTSVSGGLTTFNGTATVDSAVDITSDVKLLTGADVTYEDTSKIQNANSLIAAGGTLNLQNSAIDSNVNLGDVDVSASTLNLKIDANFVTENADIISADSVTGSNGITITNIMLLVDGGTECPDYVQITDDSITYGTIVLNNTKTTVSNNTSVGSLLLATENGSNISGGVAGATYLYYEHYDLTNAITSNIVTKAYLLDTAGESITGPLTMGGTSLSIDGQGKTIGSSVSGDDGIVLASSSQNLAIYDATVQGFGTAIDNTNGGTVTLEDVTMTGNTTAVKNNGTLNLAGTSAVKNISNDAGYGDTNVVADADGYASTVTLTGTVNQKTVTVANDVTQGITTAPKNTLINNAAITATTVENNGIVDNANGTISATNIKNTATGELTSNASNLTGTIDNGGILNLTGGTNANQIKDTAGTGTTVITNTVTNTGAVSQTNLTINDSNSKLTNNSPGSVTVTGTLTNNGTVENNNTLQVANATNKGAITGSGSTTITGSFDNTDANASVSQDKITVNSGGSLTTDAGDVTVTGTTGSGDPKTLTNNGTLNFTGGTNANNIDGTGDTNIKGSVTSNASISQGNVTVESGKSLINNSDITATTAVTNNGSLTNNATASITGDVVSGGTTANPATVGNYGTITGNLTNNANSTVNNYTGSSISGNATNAQNGTVVNDGTITGTVNNDGSFTNNDTIGGAITNTTNGDFDNNSAITTAVTNSGTFNNNGTGSVTSTGSVTNNAGGTVNNTGTIDGDVTNNANGTINNTGSGTITGNLTNNANGDVTSTLAGITGENGTVTNNGNLTYTTGGSTVTDIQGNGTVVLDTTTGTVKLDNSLDNNTLQLDSGTLTFGDEKTVFAFTGNGGTVDNMNSAIETMDLGDVTLNNDVDMKIDFNLGSQKTDRFNNNSPATGAGKFDVTDVKVSGMTLKDHITVNLADTTGIDSAHFTSETFDLPTIMTPIRRIKGHVENGILTYVPTGNGYKEFNPSILMSPIAVQLGGYLTLLNAYDEAFRNIDIKMSLTKKEREAYKLANKYAVANDGEIPLIYSPVASQERAKAVWFRPYATFEQVDLRRGPKVSNILYGSFFGGDSQMYELKHGWDFQYSGYAGYTGSHQAYKGNDVFQNGGIVGVTAAWYKGNFFTALTANVGASVADVSTHYGSNDFPMLMSGVASKTGYNWELADGKFIIQPSWLMSYSFVNAYTYTTAAGARMDSDPLHAINMAPGLKFIGNFSNGWQPYFNIQMVWNIMDKTDFQAADISLPSLSVKPYIQYGVGIQRKWADKFTGYAQVMIRNGGRTGVALAAGLRYAFGKEGAVSSSNRAIVKKPAKKSETVKINAKSKVDNTNKDSIVAPSADVKTQKNTSTKSKSDSKIDFQFKETPIMMK